MHQKILHVVPEGEALSLKGYEDGDDVFFVSFRQEILQASDLEFLLYCQVYYWYRGDPSI